MVHKIDEIFGGGGGGSRHSGSLEVRADGNYALDQRVNLLSENYLTIMLTTQEPSSQPVL